MTEFLFNPDQQLLGPVLDLVKQLRSEYQKGVETEASEKALRDVSGLLSHSGIESALDKLLGRTQLDVALLNGRVVAPRELNAEVGLAKLFGFTPKQVWHYIEGARAMTPDIVEASAAELRTTADLQTLINRLHSHLRDVQANIPQGWWKSREPKRKLSASVDDAIFCIGVIVADGLHAASFRLSYTIGLATFVKLVPNE